MIRRKKATKSTKKNVFTFKNNDLRKKVLGAANAVRLDRTALAAPIQLNIAL